jgi:hypothetical protein
MDAEEILREAAKLDVPAEAPKSKGGSYKLVDKAALLATDLKVESPSILARTDGSCLFYAGAVNSVIGESESGKTWMTLLAVLQEIRGGRKVLFIDFEDSAPRVFKRLIDMGATHEQLLAHFDYIQPEGWFGEEQRAEFEAFGISTYTLTVIDGVTEALNNHGLSGRSEDDTPTFYRLMPKWIASRGPATVLIDHVPKSKDNRNGHAIGSQHKKAAITGASYTVEPKAPMGRGHHGWSYITLAKDKLGGVDYSSRSGVSSGRFIGTLHVDSDATDDYRVTARIEPPSAAPVVAGTVPAVHTREAALRREVTDKAKDLGIAFSIASMRALLTKGDYTERANAIKYLAHHKYLMMVGTKYAFVRDYDGAELSD